MDAAVALTHISSDRILLSYASLLSPSFVCCQTSYANNSADICRIVRPSQIQEARWLKRMRLVGFDFHIRARALIPD